MATKTKGSTVEFRVELPVTAKDLRDIIEASLDEMTVSLAYGDKEIRKQVEDLRKSLYADDAFRKFIANHYIKELKGYIQNDLDMGYGSFSSFPAIAKLATLVEERDDEMLEEAAKDLEQKRIKDAIKMLKEQGYAIQKAA